MRPSGKGSRTWGGRTGPLGNKPARSRGREQPALHATARGATDDDQHGTGGNFENLRGHGRAGEGHVSAQAQHVGGHGGQHRRDGSPQQQARHTPTIAGISPGGKRV